MLFLCFCPIIQTVKLPNKEVKVNQLVIHSFVVFLLPTFLNLFIYHFYVGKSATVMGYPASRQSLFMDHNTKTSCISPKVCSWGFLDN